MDWDVDALVKDSIPDDTYEEEETYDEENAVLSGEAKVLAYQGRHTRFLYTHTGAPMGKEEIKQVC